MDQQHDDDENVFKTFTDCLFSICILLSLLVVILGINVNKKVEQLTSPNVFSGGISRPQLFVSAYAVDYSKTKLERYSFLRNIYSNSTVIQFTFDSPSYAAAKTLVKFEGEASHIETANEDQTISGRYIGTIDHFLGIAAGVNISSFSVGNDTTAIVIPVFVNKSLLFEPTGLNVAQSKDLAEKLLCWGWPSMCNKVYPIRAYNEFKNSKCVVYFESSVDESGNKRIIIGHRIFPLPSSITNGTLDFLTSLSSSLTQLVYLGDFISDAKTKTSSRVDILNQLGYADAAEYTKRYQFDRQSLLPAEYKNVRSRYPSWETLNASVKKNYMDKHPNADDAKAAYVAHVDTACIDAYRILELSKFLLQSYKVSDVPKGLLPPFAQYPDARDAYMAYRRSSNTPPPDWVLKEFLIPLGFDKKVLAD